MKKLDLGSFDVRYIVIHGMGGIGKTTLADVVFRQISPQFQDCCCFLKDVRTRDILDLQKELLFDILKPRCSDFSDVEVANMIKTGFQKKVVLIVLDDIDSRDQLMRLAGELNWFGDGSRIIITTRNIEFLVTESEDNSAPASSSGQFSFYDMPSMNSCDALQLFCERALGCIEPPLDYMDISKNFISALGQLPLALDVVGSTLRGKSLSTWEDALCKLNKVMNKDVKKKLMISYEALEPNQQQIYLDIACFFIHEEKTTALKYWDAIYDYSTEIEVKILARMSLIKIVDGGKLWMHDQLRDLGREINVESHNIHLRGSRLWSPMDAFRALQTKKGTKNIVGLNLDTPEPDVPDIFKRKEFERLVNLKFLQLNHGNFEGDFENLFFNLRWLSWSNCPLEFRATNFGLKNLAVLKLYRSNITKDWGGWSQIMVAKQLKVLILVDCPALRKTPKFSSISGLERLILRGCTGLEKIGKSIGNLQHLDRLDIEHAAIRSLPKSIGHLKCLTELRVTSWRLSILPDSIGNLGKLKHLFLSCSELQELPDSIGQLESLLELRVNHSRIRKLPCSIGHLERLKIFKIGGENLETLPKSIGRLQSLVELNVFWSTVGDLKQSRAKILPNYIGHLKKLKILKIDLLRQIELPKSIGLLENLEVLEARNLKGEIPSEIGALSSLKNADFTFGRFKGLPTTINQLTNLQNLDLYMCDSIQQLPELPKSLTELSFSRCSLTTIPDLSNLSNLVRLRMYNGRSLVRLPPSLQDLALYDVESPFDCSLSSNLENLSNVHIEGCHLGEIGFKALEKLPKFHDLRIHYSPSLKTLPVLPGLEEIRTLRLIFLPQLTEIQGLGELKSLRDLVFVKCDSIKSLDESDMSNLQNLKKLYFFDCESLERVPGVPKSCKLTVDGCPRFNKDG